MSNLCHHHPDACKHDICSVHVDAPILKHLLDFVESAIMKDKDRMYLSAYAGEIGLRCKNLLQIR